MAPEEKNEETAETSGKSAKPKAWGLTLLLLLGFLVGGGFYALNSMKDAAQKLAETANNGALTDDSLYSGAGRAAGADPVFAGQEGAQAPQKPAGSALNPALKPGWVKEIADARAAASGASGSFQGGAAEQEERGQQAAGASAGAQQAGAAMGARLEARAGFRPSGAKASANTAPVPTGEMQFNGAVVGGATVQKETKAAAPRKAARGGVLDALKGAFRASLYGARVASQDSAKNWIAKSFDANEEPTSAIEYDEKMKAKLDVVNPNSIPKFLREQDISAAEAKTLGAAKVSKPEGDLDGTKAALKADKDYQSKNIGKQAADGVLNGLFSGVAKGSDNGEDYSRTGDGAGTLQEGGVSPMGLQSLYQTDEFGNTLVPCGDGMTCIFGQDGGILGCEDSNAGMCLMAGADNCSADMTLGDFSGS